jgi:predicted ATPase
VALKNEIKAKVPVLSQFTDRFTTTITSEKKDDLKNGQAQPENKNIYDDFYTLLELISNINPVILVVDDLQWADVASLRLFHYLARRVNKSAVTILGITRSDRFDLQDDGKPTELVDLLARMRREDLYEKIDLDKLSRENSEQLVNKSLTNTALSDEFYSSLYEETKGNPFFILETIKSLQKNGGLIYDNDIWIDTHIDFKMAVPSRVEDIFIRRLSTISEEQREILQVAAVIGYKFDPLLLSSILEIPKIKLLLGQLVFFLIVLFRKPPLGKITLRQ